MDKDEKSGDKAKDDIKDEDVKEDGKDKTETKTESEGAQEQRELSEVIVSAQQIPEKSFAEEPDTGKMLKKNLDKSAHIQYYSRVTLKTVYAQAQTTPARRSVGRYLKWGCISVPIIPSKPLGLASGLLVC